MNRSAPAILCLAGLLACAAGCGVFRPDPMPPEPVVDTSGLTPPPPLIQPDNPDTPYARMAQVVPGAPGPNRAAWPDKTLQLGRPWLPRRIVFGVRPIFYTEQWTPPWLVIEHHIPEPEM